MLHPKQIYRPQLITKHVCSIRPSGTSSQCPSNCSTAAAGVVPESNCTAVALIGRASLSLQISHVTGQCCRLDTACQLCTALLTPSTNLASVESSSCSQAYGGVAVTIVVALKANDKGIVAMDVRRASNNKKRPQLRPVCAVRVYQMRESG